MTITIPFWIIPVAGFICGVVGAMTSDLLNRKKKCNHTALISKETPTWVNRAEQRKKDQAAGKKIAIMEIRAEIERRMNQLRMACGDKVFSGAEKRNMVVAYEELSRLLPLLDTFL